MTADDLRRLVERAERYREPLSPSEMGTVLFALIDAQRDVLRRVRPAVESLDEDAMKEILADIDALVGGEDS